MSDRIGDAFHVYAEAGIVPARSVGKAVKAIRRWIDHGRWRSRPDRFEWEPWPSVGVPAPAGPALALTEADAKRWLADHGIPVPQAALTRTRDEAVAAAERIGFPVVAKVASAAIQHKTEVGGVVVGLYGDAAVAQAWDRIHTSAAARAPEAPIEGVLIERMAPAGGVEVLVGVSRDPVFGHVLTFGLGGIHVEVFKDVARRLLPLSAGEAERMVREIRSFALLDGARGRPKADLAALCELLLNVSRFVEAHAQRIDELDLNPVWVGAAGQGVLALDAVIVGRQAVAR
jgi:acyl-CoA synthetase (NDP forming)